MFDAGLELSRWMVSGFGPDWQTALAVPLLIVLLLLALTAIVRLLPVVDRVLAPLGTGLSMLIGMVMLLPEYLCTVALRRQNRAPPGFLYTYGDGVSGLVHLGERVSKAGISGLTRGSGVRRVLILFALVLIVAIGNGNACPPEASRCSPPLTAWWSQVTTIFGDDAPPPKKPKPTRKPTKKPASRKTG